MRMPMKKFIRNPSDIIIDFVIYVLCALVFVSVAYPLYFIIIASFSDPSHVIQGKVILWPKGVNLFGYNAILNDKRIWLGYKNTIIYTVLGTAINLILTVPASYALSVRTFRARRYIMAMFVFTMFFGGGLIPTYILIKDLKMINTIWAMVLPFCVNVYNVIITRTYFQSSIPIELYESAILDGCSHFKYLLHVVLPLSKAILYVIGLYYFVGHWNNFFSALLYLNKDKMQPLQIVLRSILLMMQTTQGSIGSGAVGIGAYS